MAFTSVRTRAEDNVIGDRRIATGTYTNTSGSIGGDIDTGLLTVESVTLQPKGSAVATNAPVVNESMPADGSAVTIVTDADEVGTWIAYGF